jgi:hypothetical protein
MRMRGPAMLVASLGIVATGAVASTPSYETRPAAESLASCFLDSGPVYLYGRVIYLWYCHESGWHGQIANGSAGDQVWLYGLTQNPTAFATIPGGQTSANTPDVGGAGSPWKACGKANDRPEAACTPWSDGT